ncbi:AMP-binding protein [Streptomyces capparidis]
MPLLSETIGGVLRRTAAAHPGKEALVECATGLRRTYAQLDRAVDEVAAGLLAAGVDRGDRVALWAPDCAEWVFTQYAAARIGAVLVNVGRVRRARELERVLRRTGATLLLAHPAYHGGHPAAAWVGRVLPGLDIAVIGGRRWREMLAAGARLPRDHLAAREAEVSAYDAVVMQHTTGITGLPRAVALSHHNILNNGHYVAERLGHGHRDRICLPVPQHHCFGLVTGALGAVSHGACVILPGPSFDPEATLRAVERERATSLYGLSTTFLALLDLLPERRYDLSSLRTGLVAGAPCPVEVVRRVVAELGLSELCVAYGTPEPGPLPAPPRPAAAEPPGEAPPRPEVKVVDRAGGLTVERGEPGEPHPRGASAMLGYWDAPDRAAEPGDEPRRPHTGDLAVMRRDGRLTLVGRVRDVIVRGGDKIHPREVEEFLHSHPKIAEVQVVGVPDPKYGEEVLACVVLNDPEDTLTAEELYRFCADRLAAWKTPRYVRVLDAFPTTVGGKVRKTQLRAWAAGDLALLG